MWGKCRDRPEIVKRLSSRTLSLILFNKSSFTKDGRPLRASTCTFSRPSLNIRTHFLTMPSLITLLPYTWQIWWWIWLGSTFLAFKKLITDRISQSAAASIGLNMFNPLTPKDHYIGRTAPLTSKRCILYIYSTNTGNEYFKIGIYCQFFLFRMQFVS